MIHIYKRMNNNMFTNILPVNYVLIDNLFKSFMSTFIPTCIFNENVLF